MHLYRTRFRSQIVTEFGMPNKPSTKVIILCGGMPSYPGKKDDLVEFFVKKGYWVFIPRYRGSWESGGIFLDKSPEHDIIDLIDELPRGFTEFFGGKTFKLKPTHVYLFGNSFGGPAAILASKDPRVTKAIALSPVIDWTFPSKVEPMDWMFGFIEQAFGNGYRMERNTWDRLARGEFYNPATETEGLDPAKLLIFHAKDDKVVSYKPLVTFLKKVPAEHYLFPKGDHLSSSSFMHPKFYKIIAKFLKKK